MISTTENQLKTELTLHDSSQSPLKIPAITLNLTKKDDEIIECRLTFAVSPKLYKQVDKEALFNLKPEARNSPTKKFLTKPDIQIETTLKPDLIPQLQKHATNNDEATTYLLNLNQEEPENPLLSTESWLALSVTQQQQSEEIGYRTLWSYVSPTAIAQASSSKEDISKAIVNFFTDWAEINLSARTQKAASEMLEGVNRLVSELSELDTSAIAQEIETRSQAIPKRGQIYQEMVTFFKKDDWFFVPIEEQPVLQMSFQGNNGKWACYARAREEQRQFLFYSVLPTQAPENKLANVAEFIARANYGMAVGNFELDFTDGEIRYKTSIDVEGNQLNFDLIRNLVYTNVMMMDEYLLGIMAVIQGEIEVEEAILRIEG
ncbi:YbjN domain-containing protein [Rivularia sp. UHCC 0363]|uniref:YbjN domain-containing protein n=1 Tax=Rivularia sp. UHCC 0363 TaxID=3110244 RepID=UPI002B1EF3C9|nr:YbjN domain-containing protein [Rivularia sp. UHCC 0363]MEA5597120.1 YbjN domain-containing protein [Rivularia sp. UHCC 0363]